MASSRLLFLLWLYTAFVCATKNKAEEVDVEECTKRKRLKLDDMVVVSENKRCIEVECEDGFVKMPIVLIKELNAFNVYVECVAGDSLWEGLLSSEERELSEKESLILNYVRKELFMKNVYAGTNKKILETLVRIDNEKGFSVKEPLFDVLMFSDYFEYSKHDRLCKTVFNSMYLGYADIDSVLSVEPVDEGTGISITNFISDCYLKSIRASYFNLEWEYKKMSMTHKFNWQITSPVFLQLFSAENIKNTVNENVIMGVEKNSRFVGVMRIMFKLRKLSIEDDYYENKILLVLTDIEREFPLERDDPNVDVLEVNAMEDMRLIERLLCYRWNMLTVRCDTKLKSLLNTNTNTRYVNVLKLEHGDEREGVFSKSKDDSRIRVGESLVLHNVTGEIDFVDVSIVENLYVSCVNQVEFLHKDEPAVFENVKRLTVKFSDLATLIDRNNKQLCPNVECISVNSCDIMDNLHHLVTKSTKFVLIIDTEIDDAETLFDCIKMLPQVNVLVIDTNFTLFRLNKDDFIPNGISQTCNFSCTNYINEYTVTKIDLFEAFDLISKENSGTTEKPFFKMSDLKSTILKTDYRVYDMDYTIVEIEDMIVFITVETFRDYVDLKLRCELSSLVYLEISNGYIEASDEMNDDVAEMEVHDLSALVVHNTWGSDLDAYIKTAFSRRRLLFLELKLRSENALIGETIGFFTNLCLLSLKLFWSATEYTNNVHLFNNIASLQHLFQLELTVEEDYDSAELVYCFYNEIDKVVNGCASLKRLVVKFDRNNKFLTKMNALTLKSSAGREYTMKTSYLFEGAYDKCVSAMVFKALCRRLYEKMIIEKALCSFYNPTRVFKEKYVIWIYELIKKDN